MKKIRGKDWGKGGPEEGGWGKGALEERGIRGRWVLGDEALLFWGFLENF
jgi:hypothetical protein